MESEMADEFEVLGENLSQFQFVNHKPYIIWLGIEPAQVDGRCTYMAYLSKYLFIYTTGFCTQIYTFNNN
jgi:hypothetical protein